MKRTRNASIFEIDYIFTLFFEVIDSIRYSRNYYNPSYKHLERSIKVKTTEEIKKIAELAADYFYSELKKNRSKYKNSPQKVDQLKKKSLEWAILKVESG